MKLVTYPRTDSQLLTDDMSDTATEIIGIVLEKIPHFNGYSFTPDVPKVLNSKKVSDHHAIIPTAELGSIRLDEVPNGEKKILFLIANKLLCATSQKYVYETVTAEISCGGYSFTARGRNNVFDGWKAVEQRFKSYQKCKDDDEEEAVSLAFTEGDSFTVTSDVSEHFTQPPKHFTEDTLLSAMERAGTDEITEEVERSGLGTPATRASIIEKLTKSGFIKREKKNLIVTDSGKDLISVMPDIVKSAALTAEWENSLSLMAQGKFTSEQFMTDIGKLTNEIISVAKSNVDENKVTPNSGGEVIGVCPRCGKNIIETPKAYSCEDRSCGFVLWKDNKFFQSAKKAFTKEMAKALIKDGKIAVKGLYSQKAGRNYDATVCLDDTGKYVNFRLEFAPRKVTKKK
jgi:DNA topoisomerase-3